MTRSCYCGKRIHVAMKWSGISWYHCFRDPISGKKLSHCPKCGQRLIVEALRDPDNAAIPAGVSGATVLVDCTAPVAVTGITALPGHTKIDVSWMHDGTDVDHYEVFVGEWQDGSGGSAYPEYDDLPGGLPIDLPGYARSRPAVCDWTGDGALDLLVGAGDGLVRLYQGPEPAVTAPDPMPSISAATEDAWHSRVQ